MDCALRLIGGYSTRALIFLTALSIGLTHGCDSVDSGRSSTPSAASANQQDTGQATPAAGAGGDSQIGTDVVKLQFINQSDVVVNTQFFASDDELANPANDLFDEQFHVRAGIGVAGSGLLPSDESDELTIPCNENTFLGTLGGEYLDADLGTLLANGQTRILEVGANFDCGNTIVFTYQGQDGDYTTAPPVPIFELR